VALPGWRIAAGPVEVTVGPNAETVSLTGSAVLAAGTLKP
jgi:hypothetical protein